MTGGVLFYQLIEYIKRVTGSGNPVVAQGRHKACPYLDLIQVEIDRAGLSGAKPPFA